MEGLLRVLVACDVPKQYGEFMTDDRMYEMVIVEIQPEDSKIGREAWENSRKSTDCTIAEHLFFDEKRPAGPGLWVWEGVPEYLTSSMEEAGWVFRKGKWRRPTKEDDWKQLELS